MDHSEHEDGERGDSSVLAGFGQIAQVTATITEKVVECVAGKSRASATYLCIGGVCGPLTIMATSIGRSKNETKEPHQATPEGTDISGRVNADTMLFGAILAALTLRGTKGEMRGDGTVAAIGSVDFSPAVILEAMQMFERATGVKPDDILCPGMVKAARELEGSSTVMLSDFLDRASERRRKMN